MMAGKKLYRDGTLALGARLQATVQNDVPVEGAELSCAYCHRYSGLGTSEGSNVAPALTAASLFQPRKRVLRQAFRSKAGRGKERPAYSDESLAVAIRSGVDPSGRVLDLLMPRYDIDDEGMASLIAYLKTLSAEDAPGVTSSTLHIATIVTEGVSDEDRRAMLDVLEGYVEVKNVETRNEVENARFAPFYRELPYQAYRKWKLHVWELSGSSESWGAQLHEHYARQPVFGVVNGIAAGSWIPIHEFCVRAEVPCLFPHTDLPVTSRQDFYALYLSRGLDLEARALARYLQQSDVSQDARIVQIWERGGDGETPARVLREVLESAGGASVEDRVVPAGGDLKDAELRSILEGGHSSVLVLWLPKPDLDELARLAGESKELNHVFLSSSLSGHKVDVPTGLSRHVYLVHPFDVPRNEPRTLVRLNNWLDSRGIERRDPRIQADAYFAVVFLARAMKHMKQNFSREYLIEVLEHAVDNATFASVYPRVSLGPGQRFASKGSYILGLSSGADPEWEPIGDWIIP
ncbi:MAG: hypothetical protein CL908_18605 [Deltaproteobacteria bacterium]|nr:hypothetical protein [Deltaproteobacteria bacterium]